MTSDERKSLAEQITANPLFNAILDEIEARYTQTLIFAKADDILAAQMRVRAIKTFRQDLGECLNTPPRKGAPA